MFTGIIQHVGELEDLQVQAGSGRIAVRCEGWERVPKTGESIAVMGVCLINVNEEYNFLEALVASFAYAVGFGLALILFAGVRERILLARVPRPLQDTSIALVTAGILSLTFFAFKGMV